MNLIFSLHFSLVLCYSAVLKMTDVQISENGVPYILEVNQNTVQTFELQEDIISVDVKSQVQGITIKNQYYFNDFQKSVSQITNKTIIDTIDLFDQVYVLFDDLSLAKYQIDLQKNQIKKLFVNQNFINTTDNNLKLQLCLNNSGQADFIIIYGKRYISFIRLQIPTERQYPVFSLPTDSKKMVCNHDGIVSLNIDDSIVLFKFVNNTLSKSKTFVKEDLKILSAEDISIENQYEKLAIQGTFQNGRGLQIFTIGGFFLFSKSEVFLENSYIQTFIMDFNSIVIVMNYQNSIQFHEYAYDPLNNEIELNRIIPIFYQPDSITFSENYLCFQKGINIDIIKRKVSKYLSNNTILFKLIGFYTNFIELNEKDGNLYLFTAGLQNISMTLLKKYPASIYAIANELQNTTTVLSMGLVKQTCPLQKSWQGCLYKTELVIKKRFDNYTHSENRNWVIGLVVALFLLIVLITLLIYCLQRRNKKQITQLENELETVKNKYSPIKQETTNI